MSNPFAAGIRKIVLEVAAEEIIPGLDKRINELFEKQLEETLPLLVSSTMHRLLAGGDKPADEPEAAGPCPAGVARPERGARSVKRGPRKRCAKCQGVMCKQPDGTYLCKKCSGTRTK